MQYKYIAIEGNIGAGKSTLAQILASYYNAVHIPEEFAENAFLPKFYEAPERYAFPLELSFMADRYKQLCTRLPLAILSEQPAIADYMFAKCQLYASINLDSSEFNLFQKLFHIMTPRIPEPNLLIYLHAPIAQLQENIKKRGREYEQNISDEYLAKVENAYLNYFNDTPIKTIIVGMTGLDFINNATLTNNLIKIIESQDNENKQYFNGLTTMSLLPDPPMREA